MDSLDIIDILSFVIVYKASIKEPKIIIILREGNTRGVIYEYGYIGCAGKGGRERDKSCSQKIILLLF